MEAIVLVGGQGTRLRSVVKDRPKPMAEIGQSPFLQIVLATLRQAEVSKIILAVSYRSAQIMEFFGGEFQGIPLEYSHEPNPWMRRSSRRSAKRNARRSRAIAN